MKRTITILLLIPILLSTAIAQEDIIDKSKLLPPEWILGIWDDGKDMIGYAFLEDDVRQLFTSYPGFMKMVAKGQAMVDVDTVSAGQFSFYLLVPAAGAIQRYDFVKKTENTLEFYFTTGDVKKGPVVLTKR